MPKKKSVAPVVKALPAPTRQESKERQYQKLQDEWDKEQTILSAAYTAAMNGAWAKYLTALRADPTKPKDKLWGKERDYDRQYDRDRENALAAWKKASAAADEKLDKAVEKLISAD